MAGIIITLYPILCVLLPCLIYMFIRARKPGNHLTKAHFIWVFLFVFYLHMVLDTTGIGTIWDIGKYDSILSLDKINLVPFNDGLEFSQILNVIMFMPLGFLLPLLWSNYRTLPRVLLAGAGYSLSIEICQLFNNRVTDINDLIMNTFGALAGYCIWIVYRRLFPRTGTRKELALSAHEPAVYMVLSVLAVFFLCNWRWMVYKLYM